MPHNKQPHTPTAGSQTLEGFSAHPSDLQACLRAGLSLPLAPTGLCRSDIDGGRLLTIDSSSAAIWDTQASRGAIYSLPP